MWVCVEGPGFRGFGLFGSIRALALGAMFFFVMFVFRESLRPAPIALDVALLVSRS